MDFLKKITEIKNYKSYNYFMWNEFDKYQKYDKKTGGKKEIDSEFDNGFNVIFGENGSGKSAIVQILKSLSQNGEFIESTPEKVILQFKDSGYTFENSQWTDDKRLSKTDIVFFDTEFISTNIHTNGCRETALNKGAHTQHSGKLLIEFDSEAIRLKNEYEKADTTGSEFKKNNKDDLDFTLSDNESTIFEALKDKKKPEITDIQNKLPSEITNLNSEIKQLEKNKSKISEIQAIEETNTFDALNNLPKEEIISELFSRDLKEKSVTEVSEDILNSLSAYEDFYKDHKGLNESDDCPFCGYTLNTTQAKKMLAIYQNHFDDTYESNLLQFKKDVSGQISIFKNIKSSFESIPKAILDKQKLFNTISKKHAIKEITSAPEIVELNTASIDKLIKDLNMLLDGKKPVFSSDNIQEISVTYKAGESAIEILNTWIAENNVLIADFKEKNKSEEEIDQQISEKNKLLNMCTLKQKFINKDKVSKYEKAAIVQEQAKALEETLSMSKKLYEEYLEKLPVSMAKKMQELVNNQFYLDFKLVGEKVKIGKAKEYPFKFKIIDKDGRERSINDGLSEGERQIISFAFFFAHLDNLPKKKRIIVFDDPVNSVDARNLKVFVELIEQECKGNQIFIFTHHSLFYKYADKSLNGVSFGIVKNKDKFGGSFIYREKPLCIEDKLKTMNESLKKHIQQNEMNYTIFTLEYGHLLRYTVEDFIKNKLLYWDKKDFTQVIDKIGQQDLSKDDLKTIKKIYNFCNWGNHLHPDKEEPASLNELETYIDKFLEVRNRYITI